MMRSQPSTSCTIAARVGLLALLFVVARPSPAAAQEIPEVPPPIVVEEQLSEPAQVQLSDELDAPEEDDEEDAAAPSRPSGGGIKQTSPQIQEPAPRATPPSLQRYRKALSPYGRWEQWAGYGWVWVPRVPSHWRPYSHGEWIHGSAGWTFVSYDAWGWAPFHYGRWVFRNRVGWCWIPGYVWGPGWVSWRYGGGYVAWAPLGPDNLGGTYYDSPSLWIAVSGAHFSRPLHRRHFVPTRKVRGVIRNARRVDRANRRGPPSGYVSGITKRPVRHRPSRWVPGIEDAKKKKKKSKKKKVKLMPRRTKHETNRKGDRGRRNRRRR